MNKERFPGLLQAIYQAVNDLEAMFPGRRFTPDGHLVGSIGEALASYHFGIELFAGSHRCHDGVCRDRQVQIKATQGNYIGLSGEPQHLLVLPLARDGSFSEAYNGPGAPVWALVSHKRLPRNGQYRLSLSTLAGLMRSVPPGQRLPRILA